ncbi:unnamed protein product [Phytophthora fragariaefolia]|uniref:Unnamed protein product n=1 Tax=Phytophthora fragariaefolia TaxID=1490495 RepID=A0A9W6XX01_9STRA|nr:unnamed protein product [Phytophthora fragariaefolia]
MYWITFIDYKTKNCRVFLTMTKDGATKQFEHFLVYFEKRFNCSAHWLRTDGGGEDKVVDSFCKTAGVRGQVSEVDNQPSNGKSERMHWTIMARHVQNIQTLNKNSNAQQLHQLDTESTEETDNSDKMKELASDDFSADVQPTPTAGKTARGKREGHNKHNPKSSDQSAVKNALKPTHGMLTRYGGLMAPRRELVCAVYRKDPPKMGLETMKSDDSIQWPAALESELTSLEGNKTCHLYDLKQTGRLWFMTLHDELIKGGFVQCATNTCMYIKEDKSGMTVVGVYVDDLLVMGRSDARVDELFRILVMLQSKGRSIVNKLLDMRLKYTPHGEYTLDQEATVDELLDMFGLQDAHSMPVPIGPENNNEIPGGGFPLPRENSAGGTSVKLL